MNINRLIVDMQLFDTICSILFSPLHLLPPLLSFCGNPGPGIRPAEQRRERVQPGPHHLQGPGGALRLHPRPPPADPAGHDRPREEGRGGRQVGRESAGAWSQ